MTTIFGGNRSSGYDVDNSLRFNDGSSDYLNRTPGSASNRRTITFSCWFKKGLNAATWSWLMHSGASNDGTPSFGVGLKSDSLSVIDLGADGAYDINFITSRKFKDPAAWYHVVVAIDTTQSTESNRVKIYVNGTQETSFSTSTYPGENHDFNTGPTMTNYAIEIGRDNYGGGEGYYDGYMAEMVLIDGSQLAADSFGEFDSDSPTIWKPINVSGLTFGTNGFYFEFKGSGTSANSSGLGADTSGNDHHFAVNNLTAVDQSTDTCTNNFCTMNPILGALYTPTFSEGNLQVAQSTNSQHAVTHGTFAVTKGVWYWEVKYIGNTGTSGPSDRAVGIQTPNVTNVFTQATYNGTGSVTYYGYDGGEVWDEGTATTADYGTYSQNSILGISLDMDNGVISFYINGTEVVDNYALGTSASVIATPAIAWPNGTASGTEMGVNFGSPFYALSSAVADANGYGAFEYTPVGYALCTKNLAEFG